MPSPNVSEDHQTKNALSLAEPGAAVTGQRCGSQGKTSEYRISGFAMMKINSRRLKRNIEAMEKHDAAKEIVDAIYAAKGWT